MVQDFKSIYMLYQNHLKLLLFFPFYTITYLYYNNIMAINDAIILLYQNPIKHHQIYLNKL